MTKLVIIGRTYPGKVSAVCRHLSQAGIGMRESHYSGADFCLLHCQEPECLLGQKDQLMRELDAWLNAGGGVCAFAQSCGIPQQTVSKWKA